MQLGGAALAAWFLQAVVHVSASFGSNYPASAGALSALLAEARALLPEAEHEQIFSRTAKSLYR